LEKIDSRVLRRGYMMGGPAGFGFSGSAKIFSVRQRLAKFANTSGRQLRVLGRQSLEPFEACEDRDGGIRDLRAREP
jgi:hypothetical protein